MLSNTNIKIVSILLIINSIYSVSAYLPFPYLVNTFLILTINFCIIYHISRYRKLNNILLLDRKLANLYFFWFLFNVIRGIFIVDNYWELKQLFLGVQILSLPLFIYIFSIPNISQIVLRFWFKYALIIFFVISPLISNGSYQFYLGPIFFIGCFIPIIPSKWKFIIAGLLITMLLINYGARSQVIKSAIVLLVSLGIFLNKYISTKLLKLFHLLCYILPLILLYTGITGIYNIFEKVSDNEGKYISQQIVEGKLKEEDLTSDTRTFIYKEVIESALKHNYVIWGRTPARGNDSESFGSHMAEDLKTGKYERFKNEVCHPNVFTWLGIIGVILYSTMYLRSSYLAIYKSKNIYIKYIGCFIAFRWAYGWIEDIIDFNMLNISLWMIISMGLSIKFREMTDKEFRNWISNIFK